MGLRLGLASVLDQVVERPHDEKIDGGADASDAELGGDSMGFKNRPKTGSKIAKESN